MPAFNSTNFVDFFNSTRASKMTGAEYVFNAAARHTYPMMTLIRGQNPFSMVQGGSSIVEEYISGDTGTFTKYNPGDPASVNLINTTKTLEARWRFYRSHVGWTDAEFMLNTKGGSFVQVKRFRDVKEVQRQSEHLRGFDSLMFARPDGDGMEAASSGAGGDCYSIPAFITENSNRWLAPSAVWSQSTVIGQNPATDSNWRNQRATYIDSSIGDDTAGLIAAWDSIIMDLQYEAVAEASAATEAAKSSDLICFTNKDGVNIMTQQARNGNDRWMKPNDASFGAPTFDGIPIKRAQQLEEALLEVDNYGASAAYTGAAYKTGKPRYYIINKKHTHPVFADDGAGGVLKPEDAVKLRETRPDTTVVWTQTTLNLICNARNRNGIICPATPG
jgi:hypothetical protein